jgi:hypothetical protein
VDAQDDEFQVRVSPHQAAGDVRLTIAGHGQVHDDEVRLEIAPGLQVRLARKAIAGVLTEPEEEPEEESEEELDPAEPAVDADESPQTGEAENREERTEANLPG